MAEDKDNDVMDGEGTGHEAAAEPRDDGEQRPSFTVIDGGNKEPRHGSGEGAGDAAAPKGGGKGDDGDGDDGDKSKRRTKTLVILSVIAVAAFAAIAGYSIYAHYGEIQDNNEQQIAADDWEHMVAGTIDGHEIMESEVNEYVARYRTMSDLNDDGEWATFLDKQGYTIETFRQEAVAALQQQYAAREEAEAAGITADEDEVDASIESVREQNGYVGDDEGWAEFLSGIGYDEQSYREAIETTYLASALAERNVALKTPTESQMQTYASNDTDLWTGQKVCAVLIESPSDAASLSSAWSKAQAIIDSADADGDGTVTQSELSAAADGNGESAASLGWTGLSDIEDAILAGIDGLAAGQMADAPIRTEDGYAVALVTDTSETNVSGLVRVSDLPKDLYDALYDETSASLNASATSDYLAGLVSARENSVADMPDGLPYYVDIEAKSQLTVSTDDEEEDTEGADASEDGDQSTSSGE